MRETKIVSKLLSVCAFAMAVGIVNPSAGAEQPLLGIEHLYRLDLLPKLRQAVRVGMGVNFRLFAGQWDRA